MNEQTTKSTSNDIEPFVDFKNLPDTTTPFDAGNMNTLQIMMKQYIDANRNIPIGGTTGQALVKNSNTDYDVSWATIYNKQMIVDLVHPVGSYYETSDASFDPNTAWGGTWVEDTEGLITVAYKQTDSDFRTVGNTGGSKTHTQTIAEMPTHAHDLGTIWRQSGGYGQITASPTSGANRANITNSNVTTGEGQAMNIMNPYIVVKRWHRTA